MRGQQRKHDAQPDADSTAERSRDDVHFSSGRLVDEPPVRLRHRLDVDVFTEACLEQPLEQGLGGAVLLRSSVLRSAIFRSSIFLSSAVFRSAIFLGSAVLLSCAVLRSTIFLGSAIFLSSA